MKLTDLDDWALTLIGVGVTVFAALVLQLLARYLLGMMVRSGHLTPTMSYRLGNTFRIVFAVVVALSVLQQTGLFTQAWAVVSALLVAMAVGFVALWSVLSNVVCALMILAYRPFRMGDVIEVIDPSTQNPGVSGRVSDLSLMFTTIEEDETDEDRIFVRVPNSAFFLKGLRVRIPKDGRVTNTFFDVRKGKNSTPDT